MSRKLIVIALAVLVVVAGAGAGAWYLWGQGGGSPGASEQASNKTSQGAADSGPTPAPVLVVIDQNAIMQYSKAGQDISRQVAAFTQETRGQLDGRVKALEKEGDDLKRQAANMTPEERQKRVASFESKQAALQKTVSQKETQIRAAVSKGQQAMEKVLKPILENVTKAHGVNMVLDRQAVLYAASNTFDITAQVIDQLNEKLPSVKIDFTAPASGKN